TSIVWAGTGEEDSRNSISPGGGLYRSTDGGRSWRHMGLRDSQAIGRIVVHPTDPNVVYVAALGRPWGYNAERGLYKTTDGGTTWRRVKFISDRAGFVDLVMHPRDPNTLYAASWERVRGPYFLKSGGPGSALWKSTDGGETWTEIRGGGFPETTKGRIGIDVSRSNPDVVYALVEAEGRKSGLYRSDDGGKTWTFRNGNNVRPFYYSQVRVDPQNPDRVYWSSTPVNVSNDGGKTVGNATIGLHVDHHAMWIDPTNPSHFIVGNDGGIGITWDRGGTYTFPNSLPLGQFYEVSYNMAVPYRVCGGLQDNGSWCGPSRTASGEITNHHWASVNGGDGFFTQQDPTDPNLVYAESQGGNLARINLATGERTPLRKPSWRDRTRMWEDSILVERGDTAQQPTPEAARRIQALRARLMADSAESDLRFNWNTPFLLSPHDPKVLYVGANRVLRSTNRGEDLRAISPDLTTQDTMRIRVSTVATGGITPDLTGAELHSTIVALAESPLRKGVLYVGTDDGKVWLSPDDGRTWQDLSGRFPGIPAKSYVRRIEPSRHDAGTFYVAFDRHRDDDYAPYLFVTTNAGRSFRSIAGGLPKGGPDFVHVVREDPVNPNLLFVGTDVGLYLSLDRGATWQRFMNGMPTVPVHDLQIHPRDRELIAGTHGRSIFVVDIAPLQQLKTGALAAGPVLFQPKPALQYGSPPVGGESAGHQVFAVPSPTYGAEITYYVPAGAAAGDTAAARVVILSPAGDTVQTLTGPAGAGVQRVYWNLRERAKPRVLSPAERRDSVEYVRVLRLAADPLVKAGTDSVAMRRV
ncbi:MAG: glycosyl hydrolase, partial [Gemmatimonadota bacterium]|nr:glycosyl hydrolase [Gemmatimonadota bacterium]